MPGDDPLAALAERVAAFHITDRAMKRAQADIERALHGGTADARTRATYLAAVRRYFTAFQNEARTNLRDVDRRLVHVNQVHFNLTAGVRTLRVPVNAVLFRSQGLVVAQLDAQHKVHLKTITQGRDFGTELEVISGLSPADTLVLNPPDSISEGQVVRVAQTPVQGNVGAKPPGGQS